MHKVIKSKYYGRGIRELDLIPRSIALKSNLLHISLFILPIFAIILCSCKSKKIEPKDVLVTVNGKHITKEDVLQKLPAGLHPNDSIALYQSILDNMIENEILVDFAKNKLYDLESIERKVKDYRNKLIVMEYLKNMRERNQIITEDKDIKNYYEKNKDDLVTEHPLIKGIFIKLDSSSPGREEIRRLLSENKSENIDILERNWLDKLISYEYFQDRWIDWETVADKIPYRFGDPDLFLHDNSYFETEYGDCAYYLQITDYLPTGTIQPYEFASVWISNLLSQKSMAEYEKELVEALLKNAIKDNKLKIIGYDPVAHQFIDKRDQGRIN